MTLDELKSILKTCQKQIGGIPPNVIIDRKNLLLQDELVKIEQALRRALSLLKEEVA